MNKNDYNITKDELKRVLLRVLGYGGVVSNRLKNIFVL